MSHAIYRVTAFRIVAPYTLKVQFDDGLSRTIDFRPVLEGELLGPLRDRKLFDGVRVDPEVHTLVWPNGADFDPTTIDTAGSLQRVPRGRAVELTDPASDRLFLGVMDRAIGTYGQSMYPQRFSRLQVREDLRSDWQCCMIDRFSVWRQSHEMQLFVP